MNGAFYAAIRPLFGGSLKQSQVDGIEKLVTAAAGASVPHMAYILASAFHETAHTMQPIAEYGKGKSRAYGVTDSTGKAPYGRGYVQITWRENYVKADEKLGLKGKLAANYDLALDADIAARIIVRGMTEGWFTGKKLDHYLSGPTATRAAYKEARRIVNGMDKADMIAGYAVAFEAALKAGSAANIPAPATKPSGIIHAIIEIIKGLWK